MKNFIPAELKRLTWTSFVLLALSISLWSNRELVAEFKVPHALTIHTALETATIIIFASVFIVCWNAFGELRKRSSLILAVTFLCAAIFGFFHIISFQGMPGFTEPIDMHKSLSFWLLSRSLITFTLLGLVIHTADIDVPNHFAQLSIYLGLLATAAVTLLVFQAPEILPITYLKDIGQTSFKVHCEIVLVVTNSITAFLFYQQVFATKNLSVEGHLKIKRSLLFFAAAMMAVSETYFSLYRLPDELFVAIGHAFQVFAALAIYRGMVGINIHAPYSSLIESTQHLQSAADELRIHKQRLTGVIETAMDGILTIDDQHKIILVNPAAASIFGYTVNDLLGSSIEVVIPMRHRHVHGHHVNQFGERGTTRRKMGSSFDDYYVTGLHANGSEFPIEASISSLIENNKRFFTVIFRDISERKLAKEKMAQYHSELSQLSSALQSIREEERKHIARELHDDLGQLLAALRMDLSLLQREQNLSDRSRRTLTSMDQLLLTSITTLRRIATDLRPRALDEGGLFFALQTLQKEFSQRHGVHCDLIADEEQLILDDEKSTAIYRIIQESLTNVARHAKASHVNIQFSRSHDVLSFIIQDDGRGIEEGAMNKTRSFGLVGMRERIKAMQGEFKVQSEVGKGTQIQIQIPLLNPIKMGNPPNLQHSISADLHH
ncbi:MASE3 domain-containing protein [Undibacterium fentianense]|uniref:PAS domain S-box protein n=1 Tax=Undibacterium fentianense TaxID=2828728 RepID=A0A941E064_9BURK|nr:MASE3 domain-containing protein [Undibacterium fentianense]MBR7798847.1 PAS domain S-box protein [Undibacterium fentianense]